MSELVGNLEDRFSRDSAHLKSSQYHPCSHTQSMAVHKGPNQMQFQIETPLEDGAYAFEEYDCLQRTESSTIFKMRQLGQHFFIN